VPKFFVAPRIVLASASPRRQELLKKVVTEFLVDPADLDEDALTLDDPFRTAEKLAFAKAECVARRHRNSDWYLGSDTVVALPLPSGGYKQFSKPKDEEEAFGFLNELCGKTHFVITGICLITPFKSVSTHAVAEVEFHVVSPAQISDYVQTGEPMDKAGAYGAQGMGAFLVKELRGNFETVVGLPTDLVRSMLEELDYPFEP
jgi:septum formation protein